MMAIVPRTTPLFILAAVNSHTDRIYAKMIDVSERAPDDGRRKLRGVELGRPEPLAAVAQLPCTSLNPEQHVKTYGEGGPMSNGVLRER